MMTQAFYTGISGIKSNQYAIDVVSDNIANINTIGFRGSKFEFASLFEEQINIPSTSASGIGLGSRLQATSTVNNQGSLAISDRNTDLAILGNGWFGVQGRDNPSYTRNGAFTFDENSDLVSTEGFYVLGTLGNNISANDILTDQIDAVPLGDVQNQEKLRFPKSLTYPPQATSEVKFLGNIGAEDEAKISSAGAIDSNGNNNNIKLTFTKKPIQVEPGTQWNVAASVETSDGETVYSTKSGEVLFNSSGGLISTTLTTVDNNGSPVAINLGTEFEGIVSMNNQNSSSSTISNGIIGGDLTGYSINKNGEVLATFTNGRQSSVGKIAVYHFQNEQGLTRLNGSKFLESVNSGKPIFYQDSNGKNITGTDLSNFRLENSNIDLSYGLTELIILQRSYDANSKSITTADQMMQKALSMDA
jgi:flagellar hook protein FlgE